MKKIKVPKKIIVSSKINYLCPFCKKEVSLAAKVDKLLYRDDKVTTCYNCGTLPDGEFIRYKVKMIRIIIRRKYYEV